MPNVRPLPWGGITLVTAGNLFLIYRSAGRAFSSTCSWTSFSCSRWASLLLYGRFMLGFSFCVFLNLAVQSGLLLARHIH